MLDTVVISSEEVCCSDVFEHIYNKSTLPLSHGSTCMVGRVGIGKGSENNRVRSNSARLTVE